MRHSLSHKPRNPLNTMTTCKPMRSLLIALLLVSSIAHGADWRESPAIAALFDEAGVSGTFVLYDLRRDQLSGFNPERATTRFVPASTFKIPHTLIGLATGAVADVDEKIPYDGAAVPFPDWARDMSLREAIAVSNAAIYQQLAQRVGIADERDYVARLDYGNGEIGDVVDQFWLRGPLAISAIEQTQFLARLVNNELPFTAEQQRIAREIVELERGSDWVLYGKTGWQNAPEPGVGWWVGWIERRGQLYTFALNIDIRSPADAPKRIAIGKAALRSADLL